MYICSLEYKAVNLQHVFLTIDVTFSPSDLLYM